MFQEYINKANGIYLFPVNKGITYVIRDNKLCCDSKTKSDLAFDLFVLSGTWPTHEVHTLSYYMASCRTYIEACELVEGAIEKGKNNTIN